MRRDYYYDYSNAVTKTIVDIHKGALDHFEPITQPSVNYHHWLTLEDIKVCVACREMHGKIFRNEEMFTRPPLHEHCRCDLVEMPAIIAGNATNDAKNGADWWLKYYGKLPDYYISDTELSVLGWDWGDKPSKYAPGKMLYGGVYDNSDMHLPDAPGRVWYEADINYTPGRRNKHRIIWSNDGLIFVTYDHYQTFYEII